MRRCIPTFAAFLALAACSKSYHPEYHPVSVSNFHQELSYPVSVNNGGNASERSPVYVVPGPPGSPQVVPLVPSDPGPPPGFFK